MPEPSNRGISFPEQQKREPSGVVETVKDKAQELAGSAQQAWDSGKHQAQRYATEVSDTVGNAFDEVQGFVRRYPVACVMGGFLVGCLFAGAFNNMNSARR